jgi:hypothetical protein
MKDFIAAYGGLVLKLLACWIVIGIITWAVKAFKRP